MKKNVIILLLTLLTINLYAKKPNGNKVDSLIEDKFKKEFGSAVNVSWETIRDISIATFIEQGQERQVYYFSDGEIFGFGKTINKDLLPETINRSIHARFNSAVVQIVYEFKSTDSPTRYFVRLVTSRHY